MSFCGLHVCAHGHIYGKTQVYAPPIYNYPPKLSNLCPVKRVSQHKFIEIKSPWVCYYLPTMHFPAVSDCIPHPSLSCNAAIIFSLSSLGNSEQVSIREMYYTMSALKTWHGP